MNIEISDSTATFIEKFRHLLINDCVGEEFNSSLEYYKNAEPDTIIFHAICEAYFERTGKSIWSDAPGVTSR